MATNWHGTFSLRWQVLFLVLGVSVVVLLLTTLVEPEIADPELPGASTFSKSAIGYGALYELLDEEGLYVYRERNPDRIRTSRDRVFLITEPTSSRFYLEERISEVRAEGMPVLIVLPKWSGSEVSSNGKWVEEVSLRRETVAQAVPSALGMQRTSIERVSLANSRGFDGVEYQPTWETNPVQLMNTKGQGRVHIRSSAGALLVEAQEDVYILTDPDLLNNAGLHRGENAELSLEIIEDIIGVDGVVFEESQDASKKPSLGGELFRFPLVFFTLHILGLFLLILMTIIVLNLLSMSCSDPSSCYVLPLLLLLLFLLISVFVFLRHCILLLIACSNL